jgi:hypothetical protein
MRGKPPKPSNGIHLEQHITTEIWKIIKSQKIYGNHMKKTPYTSSLKFSSLQFNVFIVEIDALRVHWIELPINAREDKNIIQNIHHISQVCSWYI